MSNSQHMVSAVKAEFMVSAATYAGLPLPVGREFCVLGRSNVGKSSFVNHVLASGRIAYVSKRPGKTALANLFRIDDTTVWVDLPGYGYARAPHSETWRWSELIREYCEKRRNLAGVIWLLDIRHVGVRADTEACAWLRSLGHRLMPVITKGDKMTRGARNVRAREFEEFYELPPRSAVVYSVREHASREKFWQQYETWAVSSGEGA